MHSAGDGGELHRWGQIRSRVAFTVGAVEMSGPGDQEREKGERHPKTADAEPCDRIEGGALTEHERGGESAGHDKQGHGHECNAEERLGDHVVAPSLNRHY